MDGLVEDFVTDQNHKGEKTQLKVAERAESTNENLVKNLFKNT